MQSFMVLCCEYSNGFCVLTVIGRGAYEHRDVVRCGNIADYTSSVFVLTSDEESEIAISAGFHVFTNVYNHIA